MGDLRAGIVPVTPLQQNCTLVWNEDTKDGVVVDPGGDVPQIEAAINQTGITVKSIILTHGHFDHAAGCADLKAALGVPVVGPHIADKFLLDDLANSGARFGIMGGKPITPDQWVEEGDKISIAGREFDTFHCPGHSPGSIAFVSKADKFALVGDVIFQNSIGRTDFEYGDHDALLSAITTKLLPLGDDISFICGHGPPSDFGTERKNNPFLQG